MNRKYLATGAAITILYLVLAVLCARTLMPWCDEAWFSGPALSLVVQGHMGTPVLDPTSVWGLRDLTEINRYTYWVMPLYSFSQSFWLRVLGFSLMTVRAYSVMWGLLALAGWWLVMRKLADNAAVAFLTAGLIAIDFTFLWGASVGRMDMMCEALGILGIAAYLWLREKNLAWAVLLSHACVVASGLAHPMAMGALAALVAVTLYYDRARIRFSTILAAAVPYLAGAAGWGAYIAQKPQVFLSQFRGDASDRFISGSMGRWLWRQIVERYPYMFGLAPDTHGISHIKIVILLIYVAGFAGALLSRSIRTHRGYRALILMWTSSMIVMVLLDREIHSFYLLHFLNPVIALLAVWLYSSWQSRAIPRWSLAGTLALLVLVQLMVTGSRIAQNPYHNNYTAAVAFLNQHAGANDLTFGSAELGFDLGFFNGRLVDDFRLGYRTGKVPTRIVLDHNRYQEWIPKLKDEEPEAFRYITTMLTRDFQLAYQNSAYQIYTRRN
jgi:hypothetical protein